MAGHNASLLPLSFLLLAAAAAAVCMTHHCTASPGRGEVAAAGYGGAGDRRFGGRTVVGNVMENKEVQDLGRFAVEEHNRRAGPGTGADGRLVFSAVVHAETQVVSGIKYYLTVVAATAGEAGGEALPADDRRFHAVVVVKAWLSSKELLSFQSCSSSLHDH